jgi:type VI protein secretion system component VasK
MVHRMACRIAPCRPLRRWLLVVGLVGELLVALAGPALAADPTIQGVIDRLRLLLVGLLVGLATLVLTIGGVRYLAAGGDPGEIQKAKTMFKAAAVGYAIAALAPALVGILRSVVGA